MNDLIFEVNYKVSIKDILGRDITYKERPLFQEAVLDFMHDQITFENLKAFVRLYFENNNE